MLSRRGPRALLSFQERRWSLIAFPSRVLLLFPYATPVPPVSPILGNGHAPVKFELQARGGARAAGVYARPSRSREAQGNTYINPRLMLPRFQQELKLLGNGGCAAEKTRAGKAEMLLVYPKQNYC